MNNDLSFAHSRWECKYHVVWIPKYRKKKLYGQLRKYLGHVFRELARSRESEILGGHMIPDHMHMLISIPSKYSVAQVIGFIKGKNAIHIGQRKNLTGQQFWAWGYYVSTVGRDEETVREYIRSQEKEDRRLEQLSLFR